MQKNNMLSSTIELTTKLVKSVKCARQRYHFNLEQQKKNAKQDARNQPLDILSTETKEVAKKKQLLLDVCDSLDNEFVKIVGEAEKKNDMGLVIKGNGLKRKSDEKRAEIKLLEDTLKVLNEKRQKIM